MRFLGDADAASSRASVSVHKLNEQERGRTMHGAPLWARAATVAAGPLFNFALSILVFCAFFMVKGVATELPVVGEVKSLPEASQSLEEGDRILAIDGQETPTLSDFVQVANELPPAPTAAYRIERDGAEMDVTAPYPFPPVVDAVQAPSGAHEAGIEAGDVVLAVNGAPIASFRELRDAVGLSNGDPLTMTVWRAGETYEASLTPRRMDIPLPTGGFETRWLIGLSGGLPVRARDPHAGAARGDLARHPADHHHHHHEPLGPLAHGDGRDLLLQPAGAPRHRRDIRGGGLARGRQLHLVHRHALHRGGPHEPLPGSDPRRWPSGVSRLRGRWRASRRATGCCAS